MLSKMAPNILIYTVLLLLFISICFSVNILDGGTNSICPEGDECIVICANGECRGELIQCPIDYNCTVSCGGGGSCRNARLRAELSSKLEIVDCTGGNACRNMTVWWPPNYRGKKRGFLNTDDFGREARFFAPNGWRDIDTSNYGGTTIPNQGRLYCMDYNVSCRIDTEANLTNWQCQSESHICNHTPTQSPTLSPTTFYPTTSLSNLSLFLLCFSFDTYKGIHIIYECKQKPNNNPSNNTITNNSWTDYFLSNIVTYNNVCVK